MNQEMFLGGCIQTMQQCGLILTYYLQKVAIFQFYAVQKFIDFSEFPETLMISSENGAGNYQLTTMGLYKKVEDMRRNGLPVWKHLFVENYVSYICK